MVVPATIPQALQVAIDRHRQGHIADAEAIYQGVLEVDPDNADALHFLGVLRHQRGQGEAGVQLILRALGAKPGYVDAHNNLGNVHHQMGQLDAAVSAYENALSLRPDHLDALRNLGIVLRKLGRLVASEQCLQRARTLAPDDVDLLHSLATTYREMGDFDRGVACMRAALALRPQAESFSLAGSLLYAAGRIDEAAANYAAWLAADTDNPIPRHMLAACRGREVPPRASDAFVSRTFDGFADTFDDVLKGLDYRAPALVGAALERAIGRSRGDLAILDAGCGTGLLAPFLRPYAGRLVGIDLSPRMLELAARRSLYDDTVEAELTAYLRCSPQPFDLIASSDTLVYFGDLTEVMVAACSALRPGGNLLFTVERAADETLAPGGFRINPHGRFSHTPVHVQAALASARLELVEMTEAPLRRENSALVAGLVVVARSGRALRHVDTPLDR